MHGPGYMYQLTGVIQLLSKWLPFGFSGGRWHPFDANSERIRVISCIFSTVSFDARNRRERCWFIFARGAWEVNILTNFIIKHKTLIINLSFRCCALCSIVGWYFNHDDGNGMFLWTSRTNSWWDKKNDHWKYMLLKTIKVTVSTYKTKWCHSAEDHNLNSIRLQNRVLPETLLQKTKTKLHGLSPRANYTDRATAACWRSDCQFFCE
jgi:hypothetical protein